MEEKILLYCRERGIRLDKFIALSTGLSRSKVKKDILSGLVLVDGEVEEPDAKLKGGEIIEYTPSPPEEVEIIPENIPVEVVYYDQDVIVVNKPPGLVVHPGAGNPRGTLVNALLYHFKDWDINGYVRPGIVHRLDKDTSGVMIVARNEKAQKVLVEQFKKRMVKKSYIALVVGQIPEEGVIDEPIGRDPKNRIRFSVNYEHGKEAVTEWRLLRYFGEVSLIKVFPRTGRTHQIRVHMAHIGHPLVGDEVYGGVRKVKKISDERIRRILLSFPRHALHAGSIKFRHPATGEVMEFEVPLPEDFSSLLKKLEEIT